MMCTMAVIAVWMQAALNATPLEAELAEAQSWVQPMIFGETSMPEAKINQFEVLENHDPVQCNQRNGHPMYMGGKKYTRGLYCHANSKLVIRLTQPAQRFEAIVGVDSNEQTNNGRGSIVFSVVAGDTPLWTSPLLREGNAPVPVAVDLKGVKEFFLVVSDGGDDIRFDQADWAEAKVTLADGSVLWLGDLYEKTSSNQPYTPKALYSFVYDGKSSKDFIDGWPEKRSEKKLDDNRTKVTLTRTDPATQLQVRCEAVVYRDYPTVEWTVYFKNTGKSDTPILSDIAAIDTTIRPPSTGEWTLHRHKGDNCTADSYEPIDTPLPASTDLRLANSGGRPTQTTFPYFNLSGGDNNGLIFVVSWAGQWFSRFTTNEKGALSLQAGQEQTHFLLHPDEEIRTPLIALQFWKGDRTHAQNVWRAWMIDHNLPRPGGNLPPLPLLCACSSHQYGEMIHADTASQKMYVDKYTQRGFGLNYWWMDAGWYPCDGQWPKTGTWEVDETRFPGGFRPITDYAKTMNVQTIVWFEPERVAKDTWLTNTHPEWILGGKDGGLLNLGNQEALNWLIDHVNTLLTKEGIDFYRQDFNMDPLQNWRDNDTPDRQGITEIRHVEGYFTYWDAIRNAHPNMLIDSCASGGRRNDLETLRRAVPLLRSDYIMEPVGNQCHTHQLALWFPFYGTGTSRTSTYDIRSTLCPSFNACWDQRDDNIDWPRLKTIIDQWKEFTPYFFGDYYPLTDYSLANDQWIGWQFNDNAKTGGVVQIFRRAESIYESAQIPVYGLEPTAKYTVRNVDTPDKVQELTGEALMQQGVPVNISERPGTAFITYAKIR